MSIKPYPSCRITHTSIDAALALRKEKRVELLEIEEIVVYASKMVHDMVGSPFAIRANPQVDAQFSLPYTIAAALVRVDVFLQDFEEVLIRDPGVLKIAGKVRVMMDPALHERDMSTTTLLVKTKRGVYGKRVKKVKGSPFSPMNMEDCMGKFRNVFLTTSD